MTGPFKVVAVNDFDCEIKDATGESLCFLQPFMRYDRDSGGKLKNAVITAPMLAEAFCGALNAAEKGTPLAETLKSLAERGMA